MKWLPWEYIVRYVARKKGFIDPMALLARFNGFSQPANTVAPIELLRAGAVLHARGFLNNHVIQHNLDWVWPFWAESQFSPLSEAFIPRAFSLTHINLTQRNWTAVGVPGCRETPIVDARGLMMPFFDSWSLEGWVVTEDGPEILPSKSESESATQRLDVETNLKVITEFERAGLRLVNICQVVTRDGKAFCRVRLVANTSRKGWLIAALRPYNPEGISFINDISMLADAEGWEINKKHVVHFSEQPDSYCMSHYREGDVSLRVKALSWTKRNHVTCDVGMATAAALYELQPGIEREVSMLVPLASQSRSAPGVAHLSAEQLWERGLKEHAPLDGAEGRMQHLYDAAIRTVILHAPREVWAGPYTYKRFWYRDAVIIVHAMMCLGLKRQSERVLDYCVAKQSVSGYFMSQDGEWDSNGQVLWALGRFCRLYGEKPRQNWLKAIQRAVHWIQRKRTDSRLKKPHSGLLPPGFSAEHFGPNDFYYWDDFWSVAGLRMAAEMLDTAGLPDAAIEARDEGESMMHSIESSLAMVAGRLATEAMPASPYRRMDSGAIGNLAVGYPLQLWAGQDSRLSKTVDYLMDHCLIKGAFYHDISHSGINQYLTLHIAQCLLREQDPRYWPMMEAIADLASPTGQWPEAIHPRLETGCMGDGQHVWAASEWLMMMRNCFLYEEEYADELVLGAGIPESWYLPEGRLHFGPAPTRFGNVEVDISCFSEKIEIGWKGQWRGKPPKIIAKLPNSSAKLVSQKENRCEFMLSRERV